jgi:NADPH:quinone reductase-like Zn-dependent oxidoreductase
MGGLQERTKQLETGTVHLHATKSLLVAGTSQVASVVTQVAHSFGELIASVGGGSASAKTGDRRKANNRIPLQSLRMERTP